MEIIDNRAVVVATRKPEKITEVIAQSKVVEAVSTKNGPGYRVMVKWNLRNTKLLQMLGFKSVPSPIIGNYTWPGMYQPFAHQKETAAFLTMHQKAYCFNEQGTGKTMAVAWAIDYLMTKKVIKRALIVCPLSIMDAAWRADLFKSVMHRRVDIAHGTPDKRKAVIKSDAEIVVINYDGCKTSRKELAAGGFDLIVCDECSYIKNTNTDRWKDINTLITHKTWLWMLTGTPAAQSPMDAYGLAKIVDPRSVPSHIGSFRDKVMYKVSTFRWIPKPDAQQTVHKILQPAIRFTKEECLDLPERLYMDREVPLTAQQKKYYDLLKKEALIQASGEEISAVNAAVAINKLLQIACIEYDTPVLTDFGWIPIQHVTPLHKVWDGKEWVSQDGAVFRGDKEVEECFGVSMTLDHKVLTTKGWKFAEDIIYGGSGKKFNRAEVRVPDGYREGWNNDGNLSAVCDVVMSVRLWSAGNSAQSIFENETQETSKKLRMSSWQRNTQNEQDKNLFKLSQHGSSLPRSIGQRLQKIRSAWDYGMPKLAGFVRDVLVRYGAYTPGWINTRPDRQQRPILTGELSMGYSQGTRAQHTGECPNRYSERNNDYSASSGGIRNQICHLEATTEGGLAYRFSIDGKTRQRKATYDLLNCGPRSRFVVAGKEGPLIVHNCGSVYSDTKEVVEFDCSHKLNEMLDIINGSSHKTLVFANFTHSIAKIQEFLDKHHITNDTIHGGVSAGKRTEIINKFQRSPEPQVLVIQPQAAAHGITLHAANTVVWFGPVTSVEVYLQANDRVHRAGQKNACTVVHLISSEVEKRLYRALTERKLAQSTLLAMYKNLLGVS